MKKKLLSLESYLGMIYRNRCIAVDDRNKCTLQVIPSRVLTDRVFLISCNNVILFSRLFSDFRGHQKSSSNYNIYQLRAIIAGGVWVTGKNSEFQRFLDLPIYYIIGRIPPSVIRRADLFIFYNFGYCRYNNNMKTTK